jgi:DNA repair exonuclease SbcCD nuclease subunit
MIKVLVERKIEYLFILGDFLNSRTKIDILALDKAVDVLNLFQEHKITVFLLRGNHELYFRTTKDNLNVTSIRPFEKHCIVINKPRVINGENFNLYCIPNVETNDEFMKILDELCKSAASHPKEFNILLSHIDIKGARTNDLYNIKSKDGISPDSLGNFDRVFLGHFHARQEINNILYVGSPVQLTHGEEFSDKGITIWNAEDNSVEFIVNPNYEVYKTILNVEEDVKNKFVRYYTNQFLDAAEAKKIKDTLFLKGALDVKIEIKNADFKEIAQTELENFDMKDIVNKYIELNCKSLDKEKLYKTCQDIMNEKM